MWVLCINRSCHKLSKHCGIITTGITPTHVKKNQMFAIKTYLWRMIWFDDLIKRQSVMVQRNSLELWVFWKSYQSQALRLEQTAFRLIWYSPDQAGIDLLQVCFGKCFYNLDHSLYLIILWTFCDKCHNFRHVPFCDQIYLTRTVYLPVELWL